MTIEAVYYLMFLVLLFAFIFGGKLCVDIPMNE